jgi:hypothetical protein
MTTTPPPVKGTSVTPFRTGDSYHVFKLFHGFDKGVA